MTQPNRPGVDSPQYWASANCPRCDGTGRQGSLRPECLGWEWCSCAKANREAAKRLELQVGDGRPGVTWGEGC